MKYGRCDLVGRWRVPSCAYVDFSPPAAASVVCRQRVFECICSVHCIVIFCENDRTTQAAVLHQILLEAWR